VAAVAVANSRLEFRLSEDVKDRLNLAAELVDEPVGEFVRRAAEERADQVLRDQRETVVPADYFDRLLAALDEPDVAGERLARAAQRARTVVREA
jgi:uncharacterized protein (DUF1778 family)